MSLAMDSSGRPETRHALDTAFVNAVTEHGATVRRYCLTLTGHPDAAEDLAQEAWLRAYTAALYAAKPLVVPYLLRIARNTWVDRCRKGDWKVEPLEQVDVPAQSAPDPLELRDAVKVLAQHLPKTQQLIFLLREVFRFTAAEISEWAGTSEGAVKAALHRARTTLERLRCPEWGIHRLEVLAQDDETVVDAYLAAVQSGNPNALFIELAHLYSNKSYASETPPITSRQTRIFPGDIGIQMAA